MCAHARRTANNKQACHALHMARATTIRSVRASNSTGSWRVWLCAAQRCSQPGSNSKSCTHNNKACKQGQTPQNSSGGAALRQPSFGHHTLACATTAVGTAIDWVWGPVNLHQQRSATAHRAPSKTQFRLVQSPSSKHVMPPLQGGQGPPQSTADSPLFLMPSLQLGLGATGTGAGAGAGGLGAGGGEAGGGGGVAGAGGVPTAAHTPLLHTLLVQSQRLLWCVTQQCRQQHRRRRRPSEREALGMCIQRLCFVMHTLAAEGRQPLTRSAGQRRTRRCSRRRRSRHLRQQAFKGCTWQQRA
jgi:hypothetical protein